MLSCTSNKKKVYKSSVTLKTKNCTIFTVATVRHSLKQAPLHFNTKRARRSQKVQWQCVTDKPKLMKQKWIQSLRPSQIQSHLFTPPITSSVNQSSQSAQGRIKWVKSSRQPLEPNSMKKLTHRLSLLIQHWWIEILKSYKRKYILKRRWWGKRGCCKLNNSTTQPMSLRQRNMMRECSMTSRKLIYLLTL